MDTQNDLPDSLTVGPLTVGVARTAYGLRVVGSSDATRVLAFVVNAALDGVLDGLRAAMRDARSIAAHGLFVLRPGDFDGPPTGGESWRLLTGTDPGDDTYILGAEFLPHTLMVPRGVLAALLDALDSPSARRS